MEGQVGEDFLKTEATTVSFLELNKETYFYTKIMPNNLIYNFGKITFFVHASNIPFKKGLFKLFKITKFQPPVCWAF